MDLCAKRSQVNYSKGHNIIRTNTGDIFYMIGMICLALRSMFIMSSRDSNSITMVHLLNNTLTIND